MATTQEWLLKVISGPHQGAELPIESAQTLVGADDECDVVFHDLLVAPQHLTLVLEGGELFVEPLGGRVFVGGKRIRESRQKVEEFSFITVGSTHFVLGRVRSKWPLLSAADIPLLEKEVEEPSANASAEEGSESSTAETQDGTPETPAVVQNKKAAWFGVALGVLLLLVSLYAFQRLNLGGLVGEQGEPIELTQKEKAQALLKELNLGKHIQIEISGNRLKATGYVENDEVGRMLQERLRTEMPGIRTQIWSIERIATTARKMLLQNKLPLQVEVMSEGELKVKGVAEDEATWQKTKSLLINDIPGVSNLVDEVNLKKQPIALRADPAPKVVDTPMAALTETSAAQGTLSASEIPIDERSVQFIQDSPEDFAWVKLSDGSVLFLGAKLVDGSTVVEIKRTGITLLQDGEKRVIMMGENLTKNSTKLKSAEAVRVE